MIVVSDKALHVFFIREKSAAGKVEKNEPNMQ